MRSCRTAPQYSLDAGRVRTATRRPQVSDVQIHDQCAVLSGRGLYQSFRLFERERIDVALGLAQVLYEDHRIFADELAPLRDRKDRAQPRDHHVDPSRSDRLTV